MLPRIDGERTISYQPALDGLRAVAVTLVLLFHAGFAWMPAGYLGVSMFFTLSGFLITSLLLTEHSRTGTVSLGRFYTRRARRLLPASLLCIALVLLARSVGLFDRVASLRRDSTSAVLQVFNWARLSGGTSYANLFNTAKGSTTSPLEHYWSLSVEEQFYMLWPIAVVGMLALARRRRWTVVRPIAVVTLIFIAAAPLIARWFGSDAAYWATPARFGEILIGSLLAAVMVRARPARAWTCVLTAPLLVLIVVLAHTLPSGSGPAYRGLLPLFALLSGGLIYALQVPGVVRSVLSTAPLVWIGRISYGLYLFHWPIFVAMRQHGWNLATPKGFAVAITVTMTLTVASYFILELPIRRAAPRPLRSLVAAMSATAFALGAIVLLPAAIPLVHVDASALRHASLQQADHLVELRATGAASDPVRVASEPPAMIPIAADEASHPDPLVLYPAMPAPPTRPVRVLMVGDSTALYVGHGLAVWSMAHPLHELLSVLWCQGCGFVLSGRVTSFDAASFVSRSNEIIGRDLPSSIKRVKPDVVVLMSTVDDIANRQWSIEEGPLAPTDSRFRQRLKNAYSDVTESILRLGVSHVVWIIPPVPTIEWKEPEMRERGRYELQHDVIREVVAEHAQAVDAVDLDRWMNLSGHSGETNWRPDGVHFTEASAAMLADQFLAPTVIADALRG